MTSILIVGISTVDIIGRTIHTFPKPGGLTFFDELTISSGGCAVNSAIALAKLGVSCDIVTRVGTDMLGDFVVTELRRHGVSSEKVVRDPHTHTSFSFVAVSPSGERSFIHTKGTNATLERADVPPGSMRGYGFVFVTGAMLMDRFDGQPTASLFEAAKKEGATTLLDTVYDDVASREAWQRRIVPVLPHLDYFLPSYPEARAISDRSDPSEIAREFQSFGCRHVVIKLGERGAFCRSASGEATLVPAFHVDRVVDATGAGDCWCAGFLAGLYERLPITAAARLGNAVAAHGIQAAGATAEVPTLEVVRAFMRRTEDLRGLRTED